MKIIDGGVCAAKGFKAGSVRCGIKASRTNDDTAIIFSECECNAAATYTMNRVKAAPVYVTMEHLENGVARAIVANSGNAKAWAPDGMGNARPLAAGTRTPPRATGRTRSRPERRRPLPTQRRHYRQG